MAFDITKLNQSSFRGIPFYTREEDFSSGQRLTDHKFINGGTLTESNGIESGVIKVIGYIGGDDYLTQKDALIEAFKNIESGILVDKFYGTLDVYVQKYSIKESIKKFGQADIEITFKLAVNEVIEESTIVYTADVRAEAIANFTNEFDNKIGAELVDEVSNDIIDFWKSTEDTVKFVSDANEEIKDIKTEVARTISRVKTNILDVESLAQDIERTWTSFDGITNTDLFGVEEQKSFTNNLRETIEQSTATAGTTNEAEKIANRQTQTYINTVIAGLTQTSINNLENVDFKTGDDFGSVKDDVLTIFIYLEEDIEFTIDSEIDEIVYKQNLLDKYHLSRREFIQFYTQKYSGLQSLKDNDIIATTDALNLTMIKYNDISRVEQVLVNNDIVDPIFISGNILLLDR